MRNILFCTLCTGYIVFYFFYLRLPAFQVGGSVSRKLGQVKSIELAKKSQFYNNKSSK